jgi:hypothetical protein
MQKCPVSAPIREPGQPPRRCRARPASRGRQARYVEADALLHDARRRAFGFPSPNAEADLERQRQRPRRALRRAAGRRAPRHRAGRRPATGTARQLPCRSRLSAQRRAAPEVRPRPSRADRLPHGSHHHRRRHRDGRSARAGSARPDVASLAGLPRRSGWRSPPGESAVRGLARRAVFRHASGIVGRAEPLWTYEED